MLALTVLLGVVPAAHAQRRITINGDRLSGSVLPVEPRNGPITIQALRAWAWQVDDTQRLLLEGDVRIDIASNRFEAPSAVVWINRLPSAGGPINQIAIYFDELANPTRRSGVGMAGRQLLVTGSATGEVTLDAALVERAAPPARPILRNGEERLALHLRRLVADPPPLGRSEAIDRPAPPHSFRPVPGGTITRDDYELPTTLDLPALDDRRPWLRDPEGSLLFSADSIEVIPGETENVITVVGSIVIDYVADQRTDEIAQLSLSAERAVIFTDPGTLEEMAAWQLDGSRVHGIYLEGNVTANANEGAYHVRAPRVYYDFDSGQALMLDAVLRTYEREERIPIYARAKELRQIATDQWEARSVRVTTSEFRIGHIALGADRMTVSRRPARDPDAAAAGERETFLSARDLTVRAGDVPFFLWPSFDGTVQDIPVRSINVGSRDNDGVRIETNWNLFTLLGRDRPSGIDAELSLDGYTERGAGAGIQYRYDRPGIRGELELYGLFDEGTDRTSTGAELEPEDTWRGIALFEHDSRFARAWQLQVQAAAISDPTFVSSWREDDFEDRREYETSGYVKRQEDRGAFTALVKYDLDDSISNGWLLASAPYQVDRLPEIALHRIGDPWFGDRVTYTGETRLSRMRIAPETSTPRELGVPGAAFGLGPDDPIDSALRARGLSTDTVMRADSRHELALPLDFAPFRVVPFVVGRLTAYDDDFEGYGDSEDENDFRVFGSAGVRVHSTFQHVDNSVESRLFDLHRIRHIVEPSVTVWYGYSDVSEDDLPVYDLDVESLGTGGVVRAGLRNTWQTQRGGPGRWRSVDVFMLDTNVVLNSNDANRESPSPQFFEDRPENSQFGDHVRSDLRWLLSDALSLTGTGTYDLDEDIVTRGSIGAELRHSPRLTTYAEFRYLDASNNRLLGVGWNYLLTPKYRVALTPQWDFEQDKFRALDVRVVRSFPDFELTVRVNYDDIRDDTTVAASMGLVEF